MIKNLLTTSCAFGLSLIVVSAFGQSAMDKTEFIQEERSTIKSPITFADQANHQNTSSSRSVEEGFEGAVFPENCWSLIDADGDGINWLQIQDEELAFEGSGIAASQSWNGAALTPDNYLVSPQLTIGTDEVLTYQISAFDDGFFAEHYGIFVSTTGNAEADFTDEVFTETMEDAEWHNREIDLSAYDGQDIYIAFRHYDVSNENLLMLDEVVLPGETVGECAPCPDFPTFVAEGTNCEDDGWYYEIETSNTPAGTSYILSSSENGETVTMDADGVFSIGPFEPGTGVSFTITVDGEEGCSISSGELSPSCSDVCEEYAAGPWTDFVNEGIPTPDAEGNCEVVTFEGFEIWASEAYALDGLPAETYYVFNACEGPGAGTWEINYTVLDPSGEVIASGADEDGCSISWYTETEGDYILVINEVDNCGVAHQTDNGFPSLTCSGTISVSEHQKIDANVFPNPAQESINIVTSLSGSAKIEVYDNVGRSVISNTQELNGSNTQLNIAELEKGIYTLQISTEDGVATKRFVKE